MLRIAVIGAGFMGKMHSECYQKMDNVELVAICDVNETLVKSLCNDFACAYYTDYAQLLENCELDIVDICLPTFLHEQYVVEAAKKGKHIFCEKPITLSQNSLQNMLDAVEKANVHFAVGQVVRFWPEYVYAKEQYDAEKFGHLKHVYVSRCATHPNWSEWFSRRENSGGGLYDLHLHDIDYLCYVFGTVKQVYAIGSKNAKNCWNYVSASLSFENGIQAQAEGIYNMPKSYPFSTILRFVGDSAAMECKMTAGINLENVAESTRTAFWYDNSETVKKLELDLYDAYEAELSYFVNCIEQNKSIDIVSLESVTHVFAVLCAIEKSLETGEVVQL